MFEKTKQVLKKKLVAYPLALLLMVFAVFGAVQLVTWNVQVQVDEVLSVSNTDVNLVADPNAPLDHVISWTNTGDGDVFGQATWVEDNNPDLVDYTITYNVNPLTVLANSGADNVATFDVAEDSPTGTVIGHFVAERVAQP